MLVAMRSSRAARHSRTLPAGPGPRTRIGVRRGLGLTLRSSLCLGLILAAIAPLALAASTTQSQTASAGGTTATVSYRHTTSATVAPYSMVRLSITRGGQRLFSGTVDALLCRTQCWPALGTGPIVRVADLERGSSPDVVLNLYSGGAHCCFVTQVYRYDPGSQTYAVVQRDFGDPGAKLETLGGALVFRSADDRFAYTFAAFAFSGLPIQIWSFAGGSFADVTRRYPSLIRADAAQWWKAYLANRKQGFGLGFVAAWAADEDLLGQSSLVAGRLAALDRAGELRSSAGFATQGAAFVRQLQAFLAETGYTG
jgi:hypothetical protein